jgi:hypothetical protein
LLWVAVACSVVLSFCRLSVQFCLFVQLAAAHC